MDKKIGFTRHATTVLAERRIDADWVRRVLAAPDRTETDARDRTRRLAFGKIPEFGGRWLRVVYVEAGDEIRIITAFFSTEVWRGDHEGDL